MTLQDLLVAAVTSIAAFGYGVQAHGDHHVEQQQIILPPDADWATRHMAEEHSIVSFDPASFFNLHDYDSTNEWTAEDILKTYGLKDESNQNVSQADKDAAVKKILDLYDHDGSGTVSFAEFTLLSAKGVKLPDLGYGPGHHGDYEFEYEQHHWLKYHDENTKEEDLTHPEDIEHFRKHEEMEAMLEKQEQEDRLAIVERNIPEKFRRS